MKVEQMYTNCLAQAAYYIESEGKVAVIDPIRDIEIYINKAKENGHEIVYIFETHFHADFVSGHLDLAKKTGAKIIYGPQANTGFDAYIAKDNETFKLGKLTITALHTPGHTLESTCYLLKDENGKDHSVFTGDTLFVGDVGRPDLLDGIMSSEELAGMMYDSLNNKIKVLADDVIVYPGHGPGSACGKNLGKETLSTIGEQKAKNYALLATSKEELIKELTNGISPAPAYFFKDAGLNKQGYASIDELRERALRPLGVTDFESEIAKGAVIIDTRNPDDFELGFIKGAINIGLNGQFAIWAATLFDLSQRIILVCEEGKEKESVDRLARTGFDQMYGYLEGGMPVWSKSRKEIDMIISITPEEFALDYKYSEPLILDVRKENEFNGGHFGKAQFFTLQDIPTKYNQLDKNETYYIHCAGGYRSMIAASMLKSKGFDRVKNVYGGFAKIKETGLDVVENKAKTNA